jgi:hypothetical protein
MASPTTDAIMILASQAQAIQTSQSHNLLYLGRSNAQQLNPLQNSHPRGSNEQQLNPIPNSRAIMLQSSAVVEATATFPNQPP